MVFSDVNSFLLYKENVWVGSKKARFFKDNFDFSENSMNFKMKFSMFSENIDATNIFQCFE